MKTIIQIWNPRTSRFSMCDFLNELCEAGFNEYEPTFKYKNVNSKEVSNGDLLYIYCHGVGVAGVVAKGEIIKDEDCGRKRCDEIKVHPFIMIDPSTVPLLKLPELAHKYTDQTIILSTEQAMEMNKKWEAYMSENKSEFEEYSHSEEYRGWGKLFINDQERAYLYFNSEKDYAQVRMSKRGGLKISYVNDNHKTIIESRGISWRNLLAFFSVSSNRELVDLFVRKFGGIEVVRPLCDFLVLNDFSFNFDSYTEVEW